MFGRMRDFENNKKLSHHEYNQPLAYPKAPWMHWVYLFQIHFSKITSSLEKQEICWNGQ